MRKVPVPTYERSDDRGSAAIAKSPAAVVPKRAAGRMKVTFGGVTVSVQRPNAAQVRHNVELSTMALERAKKRLMRPGVRLNAKKGVPQYFADVEKPGVFVRKLDGKVERGVIENGKFKVIA